MSRLHKELDLALTGRDDQPESLLLAMGAILRSAGRRADYDDLAGATGVGFLFAWHPLETCPARHVHHGRSAALRGSAGPLGLLIRPMQPPADPTASACPPALHHFHDSFAPLLVTALEHDQPILCRGGWPGDKSPLWGVVTRTTGPAGGAAGAGPAARDVGFAGWTVGVRGQPVPLARPPDELYVVEAVLPEEPGEADLLTRGLKAASGLARQAAPGLLVGASALDRWAEALSSAGAVCPGCQGEARRCHGTLASHLSTGRLAAYEFLCRHGEQADRKLHDVCQRLEPPLSEQIELATTLRDPAGLKAAFARAGGLADLAAQVRQLAALERELAEILQAVT